MSHLVDAIQPSQIGRIHNSTIKSHREEYIKYEVVRDYMESKMNVAYV